MTRLQSSMPAEHWRTFDAEAQRLAVALRAGRLTMLVGALGVGKTTLLAAGVLPLLRRRVGDKPQQPDGAPQVVVSFPDRRSRVRGLAHGEQVYFVDQWNVASLDSLVRELDDQPAAARARLDLAEAMSPAHLSGLSQRHGGAHLLFVFDHFELLVERAQHNPDLQRLVDAWAAVVQAPDLNVHFLVAVDEHAWHRMQALRASMPGVKLQAFGLQARPGRQLLGSLTPNQPGDGAAKHEVSDADFLAAFNASLSRVATSAREAGLAKQQALAENTGVWVARPFSAVAPAPDPGEPARAREAAAEEAARAAAAAEAEQRVAADRLAEAQRLTQALAAAEAAAKTAEGKRRAEAERHAGVEAARLAEAQKLTQALAAAEAAAKTAEGKRRAEAERHADVEAARLVEAQRLTQALAAAEAAAKTAQGQRRAEAERHAGVEAARLAETQKLTQALAAAEAAREARARQAAEAASAKQVAHVAAETQKLTQALAAAEAAAQAAQDQRRAEAERHAGVEAARLAETQKLTQALAAAEAAREARARQAAEAASAKQVAHFAAEAQKLTQALAAAEAAAQAALDQRRAEAERHAGVEAARLAETQKLTQALAAAEAAAQAAQDQRRAEAERHARVEAARLVETHKLTQALAVAEAAAQETQDQRRAEAQRHADIEDAGLAEARRLVHALAAAEAAAAREAQARQAAEVQQRAQRDVRIAAPATSLPGSAGTTDPVWGLLAPAVASARPARLNLRWGAALLLIVAAVVLWWWLPRLTPPADLSAKSPVLASPPTSPSVAQSAGYTVLAARADGSQGLIERELAGALSTEAAAVPVVAVANGSELITGLRAPARLAIARFDTLRAAHGRAGPPLRVLTALFPVEVLFIVRADSPLRHISDLRGRRLNIGPALGDGSHTVREMVQRLIGTEMPEPAQFDNDQALAELVAFRSIDAMAIVEPQPSAWWASLDPRTARRLRLLTLDPQHAADRRLLTALGMSESRTDVGAAKGKTTKTPAVMTFLVASGEGDANVDRLTAMASALCRELPRLRKHGHPKWRALQPATQLDTGWPVVRPFQSVLSRCANRR